MALSAVIGAAGAIVGGAVAAHGATSAAKTQAQAAQRATDVEQANLQQIRGDLQPYRQGGQEAFGAYSALAPFSFAPTRANLESTPGYQFTLGQGLKATQNSAAARGLGVSGAALRGAADYATGLSDSTFNTRFGQARDTYGTNANKLLEAAKVGENAAAQTGAFGATISGQIGNNIIGAGNATAAGQVGAANAVAGGIGSLGNLLLTNQLLKAGGYSGYGGGGGSMYQGAGGAGFNAAIPGS